VDALTRPALRGVWVSKGTCQPIVFRRRGY